MRLRGAPKVVNFAWLRNDNTIAVTDGLEDMLLREVTSEFDVEYISYSDLKQPCSWDLATTIIREEGIANRSS
jgi:hypothetical protein